MSNELACAESGRLSLMINPEAAEQDIYLSARKAAFFWHLDAGA